MQPEGRRWRLLGWAVAAGMLNYMDRSAVSVAAPALISQLGMTRTDIGLLGSAFSWMYALAQLPAGWLVDRFGTRRIFSLAIAAWSVATGLMAAGVHLWQFLVFRGLLGMAEAPNGPASTKLTAEWFPRRERGQATAIWDSGSKWGPALAPPILTAVMLAWGWRWVFGVLGLAGAGLAAAFYFRYRVPAQADDPDGQTLAARVPWGRLFGQRQVWGMMAGYFCLIWMWSAFIVFLPLYLHEARGLSLQRTGWLASIPYLGAGVIGITGGCAMTWYSRRAGCDPLTAKRRVLITAAILGGGLVVLIPAISSLALTLAVLTLALGMLATSHAAAWALPGDIVGAGQVASLGAIQNFGGYVGGALAPLVTGQIADRTGSYSAALVLGGGITALAAAAYGALLRKPIG